jgi:cyclase
VLKKRLIFTLLYKDGKFCLSRNFRLQNIGDVFWLLDSYNFRNLAGIIDELVILDLSSESRDKKIFLRDMSLVLEDFFIPVSIGGNIRDIDAADELFSSGADKIVLNTLFHVDNQACIKIAEKFGSQAVVASIDFTQIYSTELDCWIYETRYSGRLKSGANLSLHLNNVQQAGCGEILMRSIDQDGTSNGLDIKSLNELPTGTSIPVILSGGIGKASHISEGLSESRVDAIATANLLNFVGSGFHDAKRVLIENGINVTRSLN